MKIKITEPYLWLPVDAKEEKVLLHLYSEGEKIDEIAIRLGVTDCDYYAYKDVSAYKNKELEIIRRMREIWIGSFSTRRTADGLSVPT